MEEIIICTCQKDELDTLQSLSIQSFREAYEPVEDPDEFQKYIDQAYNKKVLRSELDNPESDFYFIKKNGVLAGYLKLNVGATQTEQMDDRYLEIQRIYLLKAFYGQGLGRLLIEKAEAVAKAKGKQRIWLGVWEENTKAIAFYKHLGYQIFSAHTFMVGNLEEVDHMMEKVL